MVMPALQTCESICGHAVAMPRTVSGAIVLTYLSSWQSICVHTLYCCYHISELLFILVVRLGTRPVRSLESPVQLQAYMHMYAHHMLPRHPRPEAMSML